MADDKRPDNGESSLQKLANIKNGILDPKTLSAEDRQDLVEHLWITEAQPVAIIAHLLHVSDKTIRRDKEVIRERNAKRLTPEGRAGILSELLEKSTSTHEHLMKLAHSKEGSIQEAAQAGSYAASAILDMVKLLQSLGYFTSTGQQINVNIREEEPTAAKLKEELARFENMASGKNLNNPEVARLMEEMRYHIAIAEAKERLVKLKDIIGDVAEGRGSSDA